MRDVSRQATQGWAVRRVRPAARPMIYSEIRRLQSHG